MINKTKSGEPTPSFIDSAAELNLGMSDVEKFMCEEQLTLDIMEGDESFDRIERRLGSELERVRSRQAQLILDGPRIEEDAVRIYS